MKKYWFWFWLAEITTEKTKRQSVDANGEIWINLVILSARDEVEALRKAEAIGRAGEGDANGTLKLHGKPAVTKFVGVQSAGLIHDGLCDGAEILSQIKRGTMRSVRNTVCTRKQLISTLRHELAPYRRIGWVP
jgi:hypothetical protein